MTVGRTLVRAVGISTLIVILGAFVIYMLRPVAITGQPDGFTVGTAVLVVGYLLFPLLAVLALSLLVITLMLLAGAAVERRRRVRDASRADQ
jgi:hypothetical protein